MMCRSLSHSLLCFVIVCPALFAPRVHAQEEVTYFTKANTALDLAEQHELRNAAPWKAFQQQHPRWTAEFDTRTGLPHQGYGDPIVVAGVALQEKASTFLTEVLGQFAFPVAALIHRSTVVGKVSYVHFVQEHAGVEVFGSHVLVKFDAQGRVIAFRADLVPVQAFPALVATVSRGISAAWEGLHGVVSHERIGARWVMIPSERSYTVHQAEFIQVHTQADEEPGHYACYVDAVSGKLLYRTNKVTACTPDAPLSAAVSISGSVYTGSPLDPTQDLPLPGLRFTIGATMYTADENGMVNTDATGPAQATFHLRGEWAAVSTLNVTPSFTTTLSEGMNAVVFGGASTIQQRSAYRYVHAMHEHLNEVLPSFTGMDIQLPVRVDLVAPNCNAFYDGSSINFYEQGNNCRSFATIDDIVYHEYAHGINDKYYVSLGSTFNNGAMDEGYADVWALSLADDLQVGEAYHIDNPGSAIRRYDGVPKIFPIDLQGDRHNDGQIIAGAWLDLYQLLGNDMPLMLELFKEAYGGLQALAPNGNEGQAYRDVLLDVLQADDDDGDITNGTPHGTLIVQAFARHGITLISDVRIEHEELFSAVPSEAIELYAYVDATFPSTAYIADVVLRYRVNTEQAWNEVSMVMGDVSHAGIIPPQNAGSIVYYHLGVRDFFNYLGAVEPAGADLDDPRLPHTILVGFEQWGADDADSQQDFGAWTLGQPGDNAIRGLWEFGIPIPSYSTASDENTICQPGTQHTEGGANCWFTANALNSVQPVGMQDVDEGSTSLVSPVIDLSSSTDPAISYWRWYTNASPTSTNPSQDLWQVFARGDGSAEWVPVEETRMSERAWRRNAFRVADVLGEASTIQLKFVASDSVDATVDGNGASLVEAALDDLELWSMDITSSMVDHETMPSTMLWPQPAHDLVHLRLPSSETVYTYDVVDMTGRLVKSGGLARSEVITIPVMDLSTGNYVLRLRSGDHMRQARISVLHSH